MITAKIGRAIVFLEAGELTPTSDELEPGDRKRLRMALRREYFGAAPDPVADAEPGPDGELVIGEGFRVLPPGSDEHAIAACIAAGAEFAFAI